MTLTLEQLRILVAVAEREHVTQAARALNLTQSAVSAAVSAIESRHGVKLFDRVGRRIELTEGGRTFLTEARAVLARAAAAETVLSDLAGLKPGAVTLAASQTVFGTPFTIRAAEWFIAFSMCVLAILKLRDVEKFSSMFLGYDLLAQRWVPYAYVYPFAEALAGILMITHVLEFVSIPVALFIGTIGAISVFKAVYIDKRDLKCACVGGDSNVPPGFVSLTENLMMVAMAIWMLVKSLGIWH